MMPEEISLLLVGFLLLQAVHFRFYFGRYRSIIESSRNRFRFLRRWSIHF